MNTYQAEILTKRKRTVRINARDRQEAENRLLKFKFEEIWEGDTKIESYKINKIKSIKSEEELEELSNAGLGQERLRIIDYLEAVEKELRLSDLAIEHGDEKRK